MNDRRTKPRRTRHLIPEALGRKRERRAEDRRESPRRECLLDVCETGRASQRYEGELSLGGASFISTAPAADALQLMFTIATYAGPIVASAFVVARRPSPRGTRVTVVFTELELEAELAIAHWLDLPKPLPGTASKLDLSRGAL